MQEQVDILLAAASEADIFKLVTDDPPSEIGANKFPAFCQFGRRRTPQMHGTRTYSGFARYTCIILANAAVDGWAALDGYTDAFLSALFAKEEAAAAAYVQTQPDRCYLMQIGTIKARMQELTIEAAFAKDY